MGEKNMMNTLIYLFPKRIRDWYLDRLIEREDKKQRRQKELEKKKKYEEFMERGYEEEPPC